MGKKELMQIDLNAADIPPGVRDLQPIIYHDGEYICLEEGDSPQTGITGRGRTLEEAMDNFQKNYEQEKQNSL